MSPWIWVAIAIGSMVAYGLSIFPTTWIHDSGVDWICNRIFRLFSYRFYNRGVRDCFVRIVRKFIKTYLAPALLIVLGYRWGRQVLRVRRFKEAFGFTPKHLNFRIGEEPISVRQSLVNLELQHRDITMSYLFRIQEWVRHEGKDSPEASLVDEMVQRAKKRFWKSYRLAEGQEFKMEKRHAAYLSLKVPLFPSG